MDYVALLTIVLALALLALFGILISGRKQWGRKVTQTVRDISGVIAGAAAGALLLGSIPAVMVITVAGEVDDRYTLWLLAVIGATGGAVLAGLGSWLIHYRAGKAQRRLVAS